MKYARDWGRQFLSDWQSMLIASVIATGVIAPIITYGTRYIIKKIFV